MKMKRFLQKRKRVATFLLVMLSFGGLVPSVLAESLAMTVVSRVDSSYNYVVVDMRLGVNASQSTRWSDSVEELWSYISGSIGLKEEFDKSIEDVLSGELGKVVPQAYVSTLDVSLTRISLYEVFNDDYFEIRTSFRLHNVIQKNFLSPFRLDVGFRNLKADQNITVGSRTVNPAKDFLLDLSGFKTPVSQWKSVAVEGKAGYTLEKKGLVATTKFGLMVFDATQTIVLSPDTITASAGDDHITYYTGQNIAEAAGVAAPTAFLAAVLIFLALRARRKKP